MNRLPVHRDSDLYPYGERPFWRPRWRWLTLAILDGHEYRLDGWCWTRRGAERALEDADAYIDRAVASIQREVSR